MTALLHRIWFGVPVAQRVTLLPGFAPTGSLVASAGDAARRGVGTPLLRSPQQRSTAMKRNRVFAVLGIAVALGLVATGVIRSRFERDLAVAAERAALV